MFVRRKPVRFQIVMIVQLRGVQLNAPTGKDQLLWLNGNTAWRGVAGMGGEKTNCGRR